MRFFREAHKLNTCNEPESVALTFGIECGRGQMPKQMQRRSSFMFIQS